MIVVTQELENIEIDIDVNAGDLINLRSFGVDTNIEVTEETGQGVNKKVWGGIVLVDTILHEQTKKALCTLKFTTSFLE